MDKRRVVVTGMGTLTPYGLGVDLLYNSVIEGKSCITPLTSVPTDDQIVKIAGEIPSAEQYLDPKEFKRCDDYTRFALVASEDAYRTSGLTPENTGDPFRFGVIVGSGMGGFETFEQQHLGMIAKGPTRCSPFTIPMVIPNMATGKIAIKFGAKGLSKCVSSACATAVHAIGDAMRSIQYNDADIMLCGGSEAAVTKLGVGAFASLRALSKRNDDPTHASRPFDKDRDGFVMSEGSGVLVLEELEHAKKRGATIYAEIIGYGQSTDAYDIVAPDPTGMGAIKAMEFALQDANLKPSDIDYINAHGTSTGLGDVAESKAIASVFGDKEQNKKLKVSSTKSMHGHMLGATGAIEAIICVKTIQNGIIPPTINLDNQDEAVANLDYVPNKAVKQDDIQYVMTNSFGFGGHNATLVFKKY